MAVNVNPPPNLRIPRALLADREQRAYFEQLQTIMFQLWQRTGAGSDLVDSTSEEVKEFNDLSSFDPAQELDRDIAITGVDFTSVDNQIIICTAPLTVKLNPEPEDQERVTVQATNGFVTIDANGRKINGEDDALIRRNFTSWDIIFILEIDGWVIA